MHSKQCFKCLETKPIGEFYKHPSMTSGYLNKCKLCTKKDVTRHRDANLERCREYDRQRSKDPARIAAITASQKKYPEKHRARVTLHNAVNRGNVAKASACQRCGATDKPLEASHDDYAKPLDVEWLCRACHVKKDRPRGYVV